MEEVGEERENLPLTGSLPQMATIVRTRARSQTGTRSLFQVSHMAVEA